MHNIRGFTLIEVLIALVILALGTLALFKMMHVQTYYTTLLSEHDAEQWVWVDLYNRIQIHQIKPPAGGETRMFNHVFHWSVVLVQPGSHDYTIRLTAIKNQTVYTHRFTP